MLGDSMDPTAWARVITLSLDATVGAVQWVPGAQALVAFDGGPPTPWVELPGHGLRGTGRSECETRNVGVVLADGC